MYARDLQECCEAVQKYNNDPVNKAQGRRAIGFTYQLVYSHCFLRDLYVELFVLLAQIAPPVLP